MRAADCRDMIPVVGNAIMIEEFDGDHRELEPLFRLAEDSTQMLDSYIDCGRVWVAVTESGEIVGHMQAVAGDNGATWEILRFYQRCGFRMSRIVRDAFGPHTGYPEPIVVDGIVLRDQVWFDVEL
jgi:hypothetical protein